MKFSFYINTQIEIMDDPERLMNNPFNIPAKELNGKRFDTFVAYESGRIFLDTLLNACKGSKSSNVPLIIQPHKQKPFCVNATFYPKIINHNQNVKTIKIVFQ